MTVWRRAGDVLDDEHLLAWPDEAEFTTRDFFDSGRILAQPARLLATLMGDRRRQLLVLASGPPRPGPTQSTDVTSADRCHNPCRARERGVKAQAGQS